MHKRADYLAFGVPCYSEEEIEAVARVMRSGWIGMGKETIQFETELAEYLGAGSVITVNSCTSAIFLALLVEGIGVGDEVILPSLTWCATANAALYLGATPVFCDVNQDSMAASIETVLAKLTPKTKAVVVVHYGGYAVDVQALRENLPSHVAIVEDAAHAFGARYRSGMRVGSSENLACFSFYANKNLSTGEGGAIALQCPEKAERLRSLRLNGMDSNAWARFTDPSKAMVRDPKELGYKMNFTDLQAAIGRVQLRKMDAMAGRRRQVVERYHERLQAFELAIPFQKDVLSDSHSKHLLVGHFDSLKTGMERDDLLFALRAMNVGASIHYRPLHLQPLYASDRAGRLDTTEKLANSIMTLPISAALSLSDVDYVVGALSTVLKR